VLDRNREGCRDLLSPSKQFFPVKINIGKCSCDNIDDDINSDVVTGGDDAGYVRIIYMFLCYTTNKATFCKCNVCHSIKITSSEQYMS